uniref:CSON006545 protein n=1 Tax=Culicoides sonorensis TaxID=179676 RepID=A0A336MSH6_CULSO
MNSEGKSTAVVRRLTTSIECNDISMLTSALKYSVICAECINFKSTSIAMRGLFSTKSGNRSGFIVKFSSISLNDASLFVEGAIPVPVAGKTFANPDLTQYGSSICFAFA